MAGRDDHEIKSNRAEICTKSGQAAPKSPSDLDGDCILYCVAAVGFDRM